MSRTKKKKTKRGALIAGMIVVAALAAALFLVQKYSGRLEESDSETDTLMDLTADQIRSIRYMTSSGDKVSFTRTDGTWETDTGEPEYVDQTTVGMLASSLTGVTLNDTITGQKNHLSDFGLDDPQWIVDITDTDDQEYRISLGNTNDTTGNVYCFLDQDEDTVYAVSTTILNYLDDNAEYYLDSDAESAAESAEESIAESVLSPAEDTENASSPEA